MTFAWPALLWLAPALPLVLVLLWRSADRRRARSAGRLADERLYPAVVRAPALRRVRLTRALQFGALTALLLAAARPHAEPPLPVNRAAVVIALDASRSMLADDADPNRLEAARSLARDFVENAPASARIGVASFSDSAFVLVPPTHARPEVLEALDRVAVASNTSIAAAIVAGVRMLPGREEASPPEALGSGRPTARAAQSARGPLPPGRILLLSDGVSNVSSNPGLPAEAAVDLALAFAEEQEVEVFTVPVGSEGGAVTRIDGSEYFVPFDGAALEALSGRTGGRHLDPRDPEELRAVFRDLGREIRWEATEMEVSALLSGLAALLLVSAGGVALATARRLP